MVYPAWFDLHNDDVIVAHPTALRVYAVLLRNPMIFMIPQDVKAWLLAEQLRTHPDRVNQALDLLTERGYVLDHGRGQNNVRRVTFAIDIKPDPGKTLDPEKVAQWRRRARSKSAIQRARRLELQGKYSEMDLVGILESQKNRCFYCGTELGDDYHADHKTPLIRGGSNDRSNICAACPTCNTRKGRLTEEEYRGKMTRFPTK